MPLLDIINKPSLSNPSHLHLHSRGRVFEVGRLKGKMVRIKKIGLSSIKRADLDVGDRPFHLIIDLGQRGLRLRLVYFGFGRLPDG